MLRVFRGDHPLNGRFLVTGDGKPFVYLADTAWELFHRLTREEVDLYLRDRASKGFTVVRSVAISEFGGLTEPNAYGELPLVNNDPSKPNEAYFEHIDYVVDAAARLGLYVEILPTWGDKVNRKWGEGPEIFTPENAYEYGKFLGERYRGKPVIWVLGGDRPVENERHLAVWRAMARGLRDGAGGAHHLVTYHPVGGHSSSEWLHNEEWLDFNMIQSGHSSRHFPNYEMVQRDYSLTPVKPVVEGEARYENHPVGWDPSRGRFNAHDVREAAYWAVFSGACGFTYGCNEVWMMYVPERWGRFKAFAPRLRWTSALNLPGAWQMGYLRRLLEARPLSKLAPDQSVLDMDPGAGPDHVAACRAVDGSFAMAYTPNGRTLRVRMDRVEGRVSAWWYDPASGASYYIGEFENRGVREFKPPTSGPEEDWVLVLDNADVYEPLHRAIE